jgi:uncharacterized protein (TIGR04255 family)
VDHKTLEMPYRKPPIVEATIELRLKEPVTLEIAEKASKKLAVNYATNQTERELDFLFDSATGRAFNPSEHTVGFRLDSADRAEIQLVRTGLLAGIQLAPYPGWEVFCSRMKRDWGVYKKVVGVRKLGRIGVRFQNRIDVPRAFANPMRPVDFVTVLPQAPLFGISRIDAYAMTILVPFAEDNCQVRIASNLAPSPVPDAVSLLLDIDLFTEIELPLKEVDIWSLIDRMRRHKNTVFEACITDRTRELFNQ